MIFFCSYSYVITIDLLNPSLFKRRIVRQRYKKKSYKMYLSSKIVGLYNVYLKKMSLRILLKLHSREIIIN